MERVSRDGSLPNGGNDEQFLHIRILRILRLSRDCVIQEGKWVPPYPLNSKVCSSRGGFRASIPTLTPGQSLIFKDSSLLKSFGKATPPTSVTPKNSLPTYLSSFMRHMERSSGSPLVQNIVHFVGEVFDIFDPELDVLFLKAFLLCIIQYLPHFLEL
nr:hypothetical protein Iba_chr06bCG14330 [Ipomoea batatas]